MSQSRPIYLDNHATTRIDPRVVEAMAPFFSETYGNAGSVSHAYGREAAEAVERATTSIAGLLGAKPREIVFTSGATESNNLAIRGIAEHRRRRGAHVVSIVTEHRAVLDPLRSLSRYEMAVTYLNVSRHDSACPGRVTAGEVANALRDDTTLVSVMLANNEIGVLQPLAEIAQVCHERGVLLHCDAAQAVGKIAVDLQQLDIDLLSFSGHKLYGPRGIGVLVVGRQAATRLAPQILGGGQQHGLRSGTLNVPAIVGLARALELCEEERPGETERLAALCDRLYHGLCRSLDGVTINGPPLDDRTKRLPGNLNLRFGGVDGEALMLHAESLALSSGSACTSADPEPSYVLRALGLDNVEVRSSLRFGLGRFNTEEEIDRAVDLLVAAVTELRNLGSRR